MSKADLHVHSWHSRENGDLPLLRSRDCYSPPEEVYRVAKARGMDLVAITDHDTLDGVLELLSRHPDIDDVIMAEEVSCRFPDEEAELHLGVYGMTEALHRELQPLRGNVFELIALLRHAGVFFALNHLLHFYRPEVGVERYLRLLDLVPALEVRNGTMLPAHNRLVEQLADTWPRPAGARFAATAGSDAHTLRRIGRTWTEAPGRTPHEFVESLRRGLGRPGGVDGSARAVAGDAYGVIRSYVASLAGWPPRDHGAWHRAACLAFAAASAPFQFIPYLIVMAGKRREARAVRQVCEWLESREEPAAAAAAAALVEAGR